MSTQAAELAQRVEEATAAFITEIEGLSEAQWRTVCPGEGWTVGVVAHHVGHGAELISEAIRQVASGGPVVSHAKEVMDGINAAHAVQSAACTQAETAVYLRQTGAAAAALVRSLDDEQLSRRGAPFAVLGERDAAWLARLLVIHIERHRDNIRAALTS